MSLTATTSRSARSSASLVSDRPIRPKPLIPTLVVMVFLPCSFIRSLVPVFAVG